MCVPASSFSIYTCEYDCAAIGLCFQEAPHVGIPKVGHPTSDCLGQHLLAPRIADVPAAACQLFELSAQLGFRLRVDAQASLSLSCVEGVAKVFLTVHAPYMGLLAVHLQEKLLLDKTADALTDSFGSTRTLAEGILDDLLLLGRLRVVCDFQRISPFQIVRSV